MPAITVGFSEIERQVRAIRRRRNLVVLQQALYVWGSLALLAVALLVFLALRQGAPVFNFAFWAAGAALLMGLAAAGHHLWRRWLSSAGAVRWADRAGNLEDRLATVVAQHLHPQPTRLTALVVTQLFALRHRWQPKVLVPRSIPRTIYLFVASLIALVATAFTERPPAEPRTIRISASGELEGGFQSTAAAPGLQGGSRQRDGASPSGEPNAGGAESNRGEDSTAALGANHPTTRTAGGDSRRRQNGATASQMIGDDTLRGQRNPSESVSEKVHDMIREAFGAQKQAERAEEARRSAGSDLQMAQQANLPRGDSERKGPNDPASPDKARSGAEGEDPKDSSQLLKARKEGKGEGSSPGGHQASGGGGGKTGAGGVLGSGSPLANPRAALKTFQVGLSLLTQGARTMMEPQKPSQGGVPDAGFVEPLSSEIQLTSHDETDDVLLRTEIPVEHEGIVRRIFSHEE